MSDVALTCQSEGHFILQGTLNLDTVMQLESSAASLWQSSSVELSLAEAKAVDTAGLAWLLRLRKVAKEKDIELRFIDVPERLVRLAQISDVDDFLSLN